MNRSRMGNDSVSRNERLSQGYGLRLATAVGMAVFLVAVLPLTAWAVPYFGEEVFTYRQPDGSTFGVRLYGDEFFAAQRTADEGREVIKDEATGFWCYARLAPDGRSFVSTGIPVVTAEKSSGIRNKTLATAAGAAQPFQALPADVVLENVRQGREMLGLPERDEVVGPDPKAKGGMGVPKATTPIVGLTILADFPDQPGERTQAEVSRFLNQPTGYDEDSNACSVNEYFYIQSNGRIDYTNVVTTWVRMPHPKYYYDDDSISKAKAQQLVTTALQVLMDQGFDFTRLTRSGNAIRALNVFYAGKCTSGWSRGLWPHRGGISKLVDPVNNIYASQYQITDMDEELSLGTFCHENGHMLFGFPDLYSTIVAAQGTGGGSIVGSFCPMAYAPAKHPGHFSPDLKIRAGWADIVDVEYGLPRRGMLQADRNYYFRYRNPARPAEFYLLENRTDTGFEGPYGASPGTEPGRSGLVVWHVDRDGSNETSSIQRPDLPADQRFLIPYYAFIVEATPPTGFTPWYANPNPAPDNFDTFHSGQGANPVYSHMPLLNHPMFGVFDPGKPDERSLSTPDLNFWDRTDPEVGRDIISDMVLHTFGAPGHVMPFLIGVDPTKSNDWSVLGVTNPPSVRATCVSIAARANFGQNPLSQSFQVYNEGEGNLYFTVTSNQPWLLVSPGSGYATHVGETFTVSFNATSLAAGTYNGTLTINAPDQSPAVPLNIAVTLTVAAPSVVSIDPAVLSLTLAHDEVSTGRMVNVHNDGGGAMKYTLTSSVVSSPWNWVTPQLNEGLCVAGMQDAVYLTISPRDDMQSPPVLRKGLHTAKVKVTAPGATGSPREAIVELTVEGYIDVVSPNGGEVWQPGVDLTVPIVWETNTEDAVTVELWRWDSDLSDYALVQTLQSNVPFDGDPNNDGQDQIEWTLPVNFPTGADYRVRVYTGGDDWDTAEHRGESDADFRIMRTVYSTDMNTNPGWTLQGMWAWGQPTGGGAADGVGNPDPTSGYSGPNVIGYNLEGNYPNSLAPPEYATFGPINCTHFEDLHLTFRRWLGVEKTDTATIQVSTDGSNWVQAWRNPTDEDVTDGDGDEWELVSHDISALADHQPNVWIRFGMGPTDSIYRFCGWNLDDVAVHGTYTEVGSLLVTLAPPVAVSAGAQWRRVGATTWQNSGVAEHWIPVGQYTIEFKDIPGWTTPVEQSVLIRSQQTTTASALYVQTGSLQVNLGPQAAINAGARWRRVGTLVWRASGDIETHVPVGSQAIEFRNVAGWHTPSTQVVTVAHEQTTVTSALYQQMIMTGSLQVLIAPQAAIDAGAQWRRTGELAWRNSGDTENDVPEGSQTIEFKGVTGWNTPANQTVSVTKDQLRVVSGEYERVAETGSLRVTISPQAAITAGAQWRRLGQNAWRNSGTVESNVPEGPHTVEFKQVAGWRTPSATLVQIIPDETASVSGTYTQLIGSLQVTIEPAGARAAGAQWRRVPLEAAKIGEDLTSGNVFRVGAPVVNGGALEVPLLLFRGEDALAQDRVDEDGRFVEGPAPGSFQIDVVYDPALLRLNTNLPGDSDTADPGEGVQRSDNLRLWYGHEVALSEPDGVHQGRVRLAFSATEDGTRITTSDNVRPEGDTASQENPFLLATLYFDYTDLDALTAIGLENLAAVVDDETGEALPLEDAQVQPAIFKLSGPTEWRNSGYTETGIPEGAYAVEFRQVAQWTAPTNIPVGIAAGETTTVTGTYEAVFQAGSLTVTIEPEDAVEAGAQWRRLGTDDWYDSGETETGVPAGSHTVEFKTVSGWLKPANLPVTVEADEETEASGTYTPTGSLRVTLAPQAAVDAGAQWRYSGSLAWRNSGETATGVPVGERTVEFKTVTGWTKPASASVTVSAGQTATLTGTYTRQSGGFNCRFPAKSMAPFVEVTVYEPVFPSAQDEQGLRVAAPLSTLAVRLRSNESIDADLVWGTVIWGDSFSVDTFWMPLDEADGGDGWVVYQPQTPWTPGETLTFTAGAFTVSGVEVGPFTFEFVVADMADDESVGVFELADAAFDAPALAHSAGPVYRVHPDRVFLAPVTIQLPAPEGVPASVLEPAYLFEDEDGARWVAGDHVAGWLEPGSVRVVEVDGAVYIEFQARHGGTVQLRRRAQGLSSAGLGAGLNGDVLMLLGLAGALLLHRHIARRRTTAHK